jgi:hypothetical protein
MGLVALIRDAITGQMLSESSPLVQARQWTCGTCPDKKNFLRQGPMCMRCHCWVNLKTRVQSEHCPANKW